MSDVTNRRGSWLPAIFVFAIFWIAFTSFGWWWLFFAFWFIIPFSKAHSWSCDTDRNAVIVVDKRKNGNKRKNDEYQDYSNGDGRYIQTEEGDWLEII